MVNEEIVEKLCAFNLSPNQAKVYAFLLDVYQANIVDIVEATGIYAQDVYKVLTALERKGLVMKTKTQPVVIEAIPAERALQTLIDLIESTSKKEVFTLKKYCKEIVLENKNAQRNVMPKGECKNTIIVLDKQAPESRIDLAFDRLKEEYDSLIVEPFLNYRKLETDYGKLQFRKIAKRGVKIKMLIIGKEISPARIEATKKMMPKNNYEVRTLVAKDFTPCSPYALIDSTELWLSISSVGKEDALILTNVKEMVEMAKHQFDELWNDPDAKIEAKGPPNMKMAELISAS